MDEAGGEFRGELHELTERIIGVFFGVANELGSGFLESVYRRAMCIALREAGLQVEEEAPLEVWFHGQSVGLLIGSFWIGRCEVAAVICDCGC